MSDLRLASQQQQAVSAHPGRREGGGRDWFLNPDPRRSSDTNDERVSAEPSVVHQKGDDRHATRRDKESYHVATSA